MVSYVGIGMLASNVREDAILAMIEEPSPTSSLLTGMFLFEPDS